jgi:hypothetical protein
LIFQLVRACPAEASEAATGLRRHTQIGLDMSEQARNEDAKNIRWANHDNAE